MRMYHWVTNTLNEITYLWKSSERDGGSVAKATHGVKILATLFTDVDTTSMFTTNELGRLLSAVEMFDNCLGSCALKDAVSLLTKSIDSTREQSMQK